jgi:hypothetical protein
VPARKCREELAHRRSFLKLEKRLGRRTLICLAGMEAQVIVLHAQRNCLFSLVRFSHPLLALLSGDSAATNTRLFGRAAIDSALHLGISVHSGGCGAAVVKAVVHELDGVARCPQLAFLHNEMRVIDFNIEIVDLFALPA